ncbi:tetratricopeptide repeat protein [Caldicellulosiruptor changbaiensis]|uniref:Tetratricopeptide repeat protein n=1 Tax=Caldicellulosiruptor changbaiensis TaxID=1222016 RepID=A0A3T0D977_9FIRM|nr:tetratricopeptide repeat protein [Caldicellulosiruptor changbaiensis]AZT91613.1 tetratricopeptide repeat protein [Caldicellulosiruptor changbaiensis]
MRKSRKWLIIGLIGLILVYFGFKFFSNRYIIVDDKVIMNTLSIDDTLSVINGMIDRGEYNNAAALAKWIVKNAKTSDGKISGYFKMCEIANLIGNPMMEEYYADLALKQLNSDTSLWVKKVAYFYKGVAVGKRSQELGEIKRMSEAVYWIKRSLNINDLDEPKTTWDFNGRAYYSLGVIYIEAYGNYKKALEYIEKFLQLVKEDKENEFLKEYIELLSYSGDCYYELGMKDKLREVYDIWKKNYPKYKDYFKNYNFQLKMLEFLNKLIDGKYKEAEEIMKKEDPEYLGIYYYRKVGDIEKGKKALIGFGKSNIQLYPFPFFQRWVKEFKLSEEEKKELEVMWKRWVEENRKKCMTTNVLRSDKEIAKRGWK